MVSNLSTKLNTHTLRYSLLLFGIIWLTFCLAGRANAAPLEQSTTIRAGMYTLNVTLSQDQVITDVPFTVTVKTSNGADQLSGQVIAQPGLGTDGANIYTSLQAQAGHPAVQQATMRIPVRGAWHIVVKVSGAQGQGQGTVDIIVGAPGAMPVWLAWCIGALPALGLLLWTLYQVREKRIVLSRRKG